MYFSTLGRHLSTTILLSVAVLKHSSDIVAYNSDDGGGEDDCGGGFNSVKSFFES